MTLIMNGYIMAPPNGADRSGCDSKHSVIAKIIIVALLLYSGLRRARSEYKHWRS